MFMHGTAITTSTTQKANWPGKMGFSERPRVLVVEDEALLSLELAQLLSDASFNVVGPARNVAEALELAERSGCQAAVLDFGLGRETSEPIALELQERCTPFITLSGQSSDQLPPVFKDAPFISKPVR